MSRRTPSRLQSHSAECGAVSLGIILEYYGADIPNIELRKLCSVTRDGANVGQIQGAAEALGFECQVYKKGIKALRQADGPLILHWDMKHFVVLEWIDENMVSINDPAIGHRRMSVEEFSTHYTGVALDVTKTPDARLSQRDRFIKTFINAIPEDIVRSSMRSLYLTIPAIIIFILGFIYISLEKVFFDYVIDQNILRWGFIVCLIAFFIIVLSAILQYGYADYIERLVANNSFRTRYHFISRLLKKPISYFEVHYSGELIERAMYSSQFVSFLINIVSGSIEKVIVIAFSFILMLFIHPLFLFVSILPSACILIWAHLIRHEIKELSIRQQMAAGQLYTSLIQKLDSYVRYFVMGTQKQLLMGCLPGVTKLQAARVEAENHTLIFNAVKNSVQIIQMPLSIFLGMYLIVLGQMSYGDFVVASFLCVVLNDRLNSLVDQYHQYVAISSNASNAVEVLQPEPGQETQGSRAVRRPNLSLVPDETEPVFEIRDLVFSFSEYETRILTGLDLTVPQGQFVGISGESGCGKTTLLELISGQRQPISGQIRHYGQAIENQRKCGFVFADENHLSGSLSFFIAGSGQCDNDRLKQVLQICELEERLGFFALEESKVDLASQGLSVGEIQRLCLAQALYHSFECVIFDEAFSHISLEQSQRILHRLRTLETTLILATHRPEILSLCDKVYTLSEGSLGPYEA